MNNILLAAPAPSPFVEYLLYPSIVVGFAAVLAAIGYAMKKLMESLGEIRKSQLEIGTKVTVIDARYPVNIKRLDDVEDFVEELRTKQAVDHATLMDHLAWHNRQKGEN